MKQYGSSKATEFSRKQIGVIYGNAKSGNIHVEKWIMSSLYNLADFYGYDDNRTIEQEESFVLDILDSTFSKDFETAQKLIDKFTTSSFESLGLKAQHSVNRETI